MDERAGGPPPSSGAESGSPADSTLPNGSQAPSGPDTVDCGTRLRPAGTEASQPGKAGLPVCALVLSGLISQHERPVRWPGSGQSGDLHNLAGVAGGEGRAIPVVGHVDRAVIAHGKARELVKTGNWQGRHCPSVVADAYQGSGHGGRGEQAARVELGGQERLRKRRYRRPWFSRPRSAGECRRPMQTVWAAGCCCRPYSPGNHRSSQLPGRARRRSRMGR